MTIINPRSATAALDGSQPAPPRASGGGEFASALQAHAAGSEAPAPVSSPAMIDPLVLQQIATEDRMRRDRDARDRGRGLLDALAALRRAMLTASGEQRELCKLNELMSSIPQADDPALAALVGAIATRAAVELCRREASGATA